MGRDDVEFTEADIERLPFGGGEFDLCMCFNGLHCLPDPAAAVREIARCLAAGARLIGDSLVRGTGWRQDLFIGALQRAGLFGPGGNLDDLQHWLTDAGLRIDFLRRSGAMVYFGAVRDCPEPRR
jgi:ubiquinone/menaquinone biosynthesis C-methylase UbiE